MKKLFTLSLALMLFFVVKTYAIAASSLTFKITADSVHKKITHPTTAMSTEDVNVILNSMRQQKSDADKERVLESGVKDSGINIEQLITLLNQFLTDDSKLNCAEYAFPYTVNYKAFLKIMDLFSQESYKYKLEDFYDKNKK